VQQFPSHYSTDEQKIKMYVTTWCGDCRMAKRWFECRGSEYESIHIEEDDTAAEYVTRVNRGYRSVPTRVFPDGSIMVEPGPRELASKFSQYLFLVMLSATKHLGLPLSLYMRSIRRAD
jgi:mycoredoxin